MSLALMRALAPEVRLSNRLRQTQLRREMTSPYMSRKKLTSTAKAVKRAGAPLVEDESEAPGVSGIDFSK
jgi:hypothetical protein